MVGIPPFILEWWDMDSKVGASYLDHNVQPGGHLHLLLIGADLAQLCSEKKLAQWVKSQETGSLILPLLLIWQL